MLHENSHPTDQELLLAADGELSARSARVVRTHLSACWHCRARMSELEAAIVDFVRVHRQALDAALPPSVGPASSSAHAFRISPPNQRRIRFEPSSTFRVRVTRRRMFVLDCSQPRYSLHC
jgi:anti-sigma factor RsiW